MELENGDIACNNTSPGGWEKFKYKFTIDSIDTTKIFLSLITWQGNYISVDPKGFVTAYRDYCGTFEKFYSV